MGIIVTIDDKHIKDITRIARALGKVGMKVEHILKISGVIAGSIRPEVTPADLKIKGVKSVERSRKVRY